LKIVLEEKFRVGAVEPAEDSPPTIERADRLPGDEGNVAGRGNNDHLLRRAAIEAEARLVDDVGADELALLDRRQGLAVERLVRKLGKKRGSTTSDLSNR